MTIRVSKIVDDGLTNFWRVRGLPVPAISLFPYLARLRRT